MRCRTGFRNVRFLREKRDAHETKQPSPRLAYRQSVQLQAHGGSLTWAQATKPSGTNRLGYQGVLVRVLLDYPA
jgi:hypothetical protein